MCISTLRILYPVHDAPAKEVLKEFFRLIGCLCCEEPMRSADEAEERLLENSGLDVDIVLNLNVFHWESLFTSGQDPALPIRMNRVKLTDQEKLITVIKCELPGDGEPGTDGRRPKEAFYQELLETLIRTIWNQETSFERDQLLEIRRIFFEQHLLGYLQCRRALEVVNMGEALEISPKSKEDGSKAEKIQPLPYIGKMLSGFNKLYQALDLRCSGEVEGEISVYVRYARINIARKIGEIVSLLDTIPEAVEDNGDFSSITYCSANYLLSELGTLYQEDPNYLGTLFLAAHVCQSEPSQELSAAFYYQQLFDRIGEKNQRTYAFLYYEYGRYTEKVRGKWDSAILYYTKAKELNPLSCRAYFKLACHEARIRNFNTARGLFRKVIQIIGEVFSGASGPEEIRWENLSLRSIQYVFKAYVWLWKIALAVDDYGEAVIYLNQARIIIEKYRKNILLERIYDQDSDAWTALAKYHIESRPVQLLREIVEKGYRTITEDFPADEQS